MTHCLLSTEETAGPRLVPAANLGRWTRFHTWLALLLFPVIGALAADVPAYPLSAKRIAGLRQTLEECARVIDPVNDGAALRQKALAAFTARENCPADPQTLAITPAQCESAARAAASQQADAIFPPLSDKTLTQEAQARFPLLALGQVISVKHRINPVREDTLTGPYRGRTGNVIIVGNRKVLIADIFPPAARETLDAQTDSTQGEQQCREYIAARKTSYAQEREALIAQQIKQSLPAELAAAAQANEKAGYVWFAGAWTPAVSVVRGLMQQDSAKLAKIWADARKAAPVTPPVPATVNPPQTSPVIPVQPVVPPEAAVPPPPAVSPVPPVPSVTPVTSVAPATPAATNVGEPAAGSTVPPAALSVTPHRVRPQPLPAAPEETGMSHGFLKGLLALILGLVALSSGLWLAYLFAPEKMARSQLFKTRAEADSGFWVQADAAGGGLPHVAYQFPEYGPAFRALAQLSYLEQRTANRPLWSSAPIQFGIYQHDHIFIAFVGGVRLTRTMWNEAATGLAKAEGGTLFRVSDPPPPQVVLPDLATRPELATRVQPEREYSGERNDFSEYVVFKATDKAAAMAFLRLVKVSEPDVHVVVETPEGHWGRDIRGMYRE